MERVGNARHAILIWFRGLTSYGEPMDGDPRDLISSARFLDSGIAECPECNMYVCCNWSQIPWHRNHIVTAKVGFVE